MTRSISTCRAIAVACCLILALNNGCREAAPTAPPAPPPLTPEESFKEITRLVTRDLDTTAAGMPSGFVSSEAGSRSQFTVNNSVESRLIPPTKEGENYRATITIISRSLYSILYSENAGKGVDNTKKTSGSNDFSLLDDADADVGNFSDGLLSAAPSGDDPADTATKVVNRRPDEDVRVFDLAYEDGRWVLKTEPDPKTEVAVKKAFEHALAQQE